jgi:hypothetical protein
MPLKLDSVQACAIANSDLIFRDYARWFSADMVLVIGEQQYEFRVANGVMNALVGQDSTHEPIVMEGPTEVWKEVLGGRPGGIHRAFRHREIAIKGNMKEAMLNWKAIWYFIEIIVRLNQPRGKANCTAELTG